MRTGEAFKWATMFWSGLALFQNSPHLCPPPAWILGFLRDSQARQTGIRHAQPGGMELLQTTEVTQDDKGVLRELIATLEQLIAVCDAGVTRLRVTTKSGSAELITRRRLE